jgi:hypothetical protein
MKTVSEITEALAEPFELNEVKFKPQAVKGNRALALAYIDARVIQDRLDEVLGVEGWMDEYQFLADGSVVCKLQLQLGDRWITKMDVGSQSEQPDGGDRLKAAVSDALKRAAVKFGIGRYLYRLPAQWTDYDPVKKQFSQAPQLPAFARPKPVTAPVPVPTEGPVKSKSSPKLASTLPNNGEELHRRLRDYDNKLATQKLCTLGALLSHVSQAGQKAGFGEDITKWEAEAIAWAVETVKAFDAKVRHPKAEQKSAAA